MLEDMILSLTSQLCSSFEDEAEQDEGDSQGESQGVDQSAERSAFTSRTVNVGRKLSLLFQHYEQLQDTVNSLIQQQRGGRAGPQEDEETDRVSAAGLAPVKYHTLKSKETAAQAGFRLM